MNSTGHQARGSLVAVGCAVLVMLGAACSSTTAAPARTSTPRTSGSGGYGTETHPTPAQEAQAQSATQEFRTYMTAAASGIANDLSTIDTELSQGQDSQAAAETDTLLMTYDTIEAQVGTISSGEAQELGVNSGNEIDSTSLTTLANDIATKPAAASALASRLDNVGPTTEVLLAHRSLVPQAIALDAQSELAWVAAQAPVGLQGNAPPGSSRVDLLAAAQAAEEAIGAVAPLGALVAKGTTTTAQSRAAALTAVLSGPNPTARQVVGDADATIAPVGQLAGDLAGFGVHVQGYQ